MNKQIRSSTALVQAIRDGGNIGPITRIDSHTVFMGASEDNELIERVCKENDILTKREGSYIRLSFPLLDLPIVPSKYDDPSYDEDQSGMNWFEVNGIGG